MLPFLGLFGGGASATAAAATTTAAAATTAATTTAAVAAPTFSVSSLLGGATTILSAAASIAAGNQQAEMYEQQARETRMQKPLELIEGLHRRNEIKKATMAAVADQDVAYAASGADLSFGTPTTARSMAFREGDYAASTNAMTTGNSIDQLELKAKSYLQMAGRARQMGMFEGLIGAFSGFSKMFA